MSVARRVAYNTIVQVIGRVIGLFIVLVTVNYIANHLIVDGSALKGFGQYSIIFAYVSIIGAAADLGLFTLMVREVTGKSAQESGRMIGSALGFRIALMFVVLLLMFLIYPILPYDLAVKQGIIIGVVIAFSTLFSQVVSSIFQANLVTERIAISELLGKASIAVLTILALRQGYGLQGVIWANLAGQIVTFFSSWIMARSFVLVPINFDFRFLRQAGPQFWSLAVISLLGLIHFKIDSILLSLLRPAADVGIYGLAYKLLEIILIIPAIFAANLLPVMTAALDQNKRAELSEIVRRSASVLLIVATAISLVVYALAPQIVVFVSHPDFLAAVVPLRILLPAVLFVFVSTLMAQVAVSGREQRKLVRGYVVVVVINTVLNLLVIPKYSYIGSATVTAISEAILMLITARIVTRHFQTGFEWKVISRLTLSVAVSGALLYWAVQKIFIAASDFALMGKLGQAIYLSVEGLGALALFLGILWLTLGAPVKGLRAFSQFRA